MIEIRRAAQLLNDAYAGQVPRRAEVVDRDGVKAWLLDDGVMMVLGQDNWRDWLYNSLDPFGLIGPTPTVGRDLDYLARTGGLKFHQGIMEHACVVYDSAQRRKPEVIIGHSLGGAAAQIVGMVLETPVISFGAPRPCWSRRRDKREGCVLTVARSDDDVTKLPPFPMGFRSLGRLARLTPFRRNPGKDHQMPHYVSILNEGHSGDPLPDRWPG